MGHLARKSAIYERYRQRHQRICVRGEWRARAQCAADHVHRHHGHVLGTAGKVSELLMSDIKATTYDSARAVTTSNTYGPDPAGPFAALWVTVTRNLVFTDGTGQTVT